jgi:hypothetical protein
MEYLESLAACGAFIGKNADKILGLIFLIGLARFLIEAAYFPLPPKRAKAAK